MIKTAIQIEKNVKDCEDDPLSKKRFIQREKTTPRPSTGEGVVFSRWSDQVVKELNIVVGVDDDAHRLRDFIDRVALDEAQVELDIVYDISQPQLKALISEFGDSLTGDVVKPSSSSATLMRSKSPWSSWNS